MTVVSCRAKTSPLLRASSLFRPHEPGPRTAWEEWWRRRVPPPGPQRLFRKAFIAIVRQNLTRVDIGVRLTVRQSHAIRRLVFEERRCSDEFDPRPARRNQGAARTVGADPARRIAGVGGDAL